MGVGRGGAWPSCILKIFGRKAFLSFESEKTNFTTFDPPGKNPFDAQAYECDHHQRQVFLDLEITV